MRVNSLYAILAAAALATACDTTAPFRPGGAYRLDRVNGATLPSVVESSSAGMVEITAGSLALDVNGPFTGQVTVRQTVGTIVTTETDQANGTLTVKGSDLTFTETTGETYSGTFSGSRVTAQRQGITYEFVKQ